ncbi:MAG: hypothetical protein MUE31_08770, partial [Candidatus Nanopelagicales bacterium]|nr:hypothetical protein [Candidatus Nanopelagicales bacterium]
MTLDTRIAPDFAALDLDTIADAALSVCSAGGASYAAVRVAQTRSRYVHVRDQQVETAADHRDFGVGVRVVVDGAWGFAACGLFGPVSMENILESLVGVKAHPENVPLLHLGGVITIEKDGYGLRLVDRPKAESFGTDFAITRGICDLCDCFSVGCRQKFD